MLTSLCYSQLNNKNNDFPFHDPVTGKVDCNVAQTSVAVRLVNGAQVTAHEARTVAHAPNGGTGNSFAHLVFEAQGLIAETDYRMLWHQDFQVVRDLLKAGWYVALHTDNGVFNQLSPDVSGDRHYDGFHCVGMADLWRGKKGLSAHYYNSLNDGRRPSIPKGVQVVKISAVRDAAYAFADQAYGRPGTVYGYAVKPGVQT